MHSTAMARGLFAAAFAATVLGATANAGTISWTNWSSDSVSSTAGDCWRLDWQRIRELRGGS